MHQVRQESTPVELQTVALPVLRLIGLPFVLLMLGGELVGRINLLIWMVLMLPGVGIDFLHRCRLI